MYLRLGHEFVYVVVVAVVQAMDVVEPAVPACPLPIAYPTLGERCHPNTISIQTITEVEILYFDLMLTGCHGSTEILVLTNGDKGGIVLDPAQHVRYTGGVHKLLLMGRAPGCSRTAGAIFLPTPELYRSSLVLSIKS